MGVAIKAVHRAIASGAALLEPIGRNTAPALTIAALAATGAADDPILVVTPSDQTVVGTVAFINAMQVSIREAATGSVVILGITPDMQIRWEGQGVKEKGYLQNSPSISHITSSSLSSLLTIGIFALPKLKLCWVIQAKLNKY